MKRYSIEYEYGNYVSKEFNWSFTKDANRPYAYDDILEAVEEAEYISGIVDLYMDKTICKEWEE